MYKLIIGFAIFLQYEVCLAQPIEAKDPCDSDLSVPLEAYLCSESKLTKARADLALELSETLKVMPMKPESWQLVSRSDVEASQSAWLTYVRRNCALVAALPGPAGDWHFPAANENFCELEETEKRIELLKRWKACSIEGGGICLP